MCVCPNCHSPPALLLYTGTFCEEYLQLSVFILKAPGTITSHRFKLMEQPDRPPGKPTNSEWGNGSIHKTRVLVGAAGRGTSRVSPGCMILGFAPKYARFTLAFLPSMMGLGSLQALSAAARSAMVTLATYTHAHTHRYAKLSIHPGRRPRRTLEKSLVTGKKKQL